jgi:hypothetical protein
MVEKYFLGHGEQRLQLVKPVIVEYVPIGHFEHVLAVVKSLYVPGIQDKQDDWPTRFP